MKLGDIRKHLMTGVSFMIPFVVPGGILIAIAFMVGGINWENGASQWLGNLGKTAFGLMVPAMAGYIAYSVADRPGIAPGFIAGMIANTQGSGFIGGILGGLLAGYIVGAMVYDVDIPVTSGTVRVQAVDSGASVTDDSMVAVTLAYRM